MGLLSAARMRVARLSLGPSLGPECAGSREQLLPSCVAPVSCAVGVLCASSGLPPPPPKPIAVAEPCLLPHSFPMGVVKRKSQEVRRPHISNILGRNSIPNRLVYSLMALWEQGTYRLTLYVLVPQASATSLGFFSKTGLLVSLN